MPITIWPKNTTLLNAPEPRYRPLGYVRRRKTWAALISDFRALDKVLLLCASCEKKLPWRWQKKWEYWKLPGFHADASRCDACQGIGSGNLYLPEGGAHAQQHFERQRIADNAAKVRAEVRDGRRIKGID